MTDFGECWSMLCVSQDSEGLSDCLDEYEQNSYYAFSYVWNKSNEMFSEFGDIVVKSFGGGLKRVF